MELKEENIEQKDDKWVLTTIYEFDTIEKAEEHLRDLEEIDASNKEFKDNEQLIEELNAKIEELLREVGFEIGGVEILA